MRKFAIVKLLSAERVRAAIARW